LKAAYPNIILGKNKNVGLSVHKRKKVFTASLKSKDSFKPVALPPRQGKQADIPLLMSKVAFCPS
jgi:hypothetical protein